MTACHSISDALGESDLVFEFQNARHELCAILTENKVDAPAQPNQGVRYQQRGESGRRDYGWVDTKHVLLHPSNTLKAMAMMWQITMRNLLMKTFASGSLTT